MKTGLVTLTTTVGAACIVLAVEDAHRGNWLGAVYLTVLAVLNFVNAEIARDGT